MSPMIFEVIIHQREGGLRSQRSIDLLSRFVSREHSEYKIKNNTNTEKQYVVINCPCYSDTVIPVIDFL